MEKWNLLDMHLTGSCSLHNRVDSSDDLIAACVRHADIEYTSGWRVRNFHFKKRKEVFLYVPIVILGFLLAFLDDSYGILWNVTSTSDYTKFYAILRKQTSIRNV
jgi:hypothetical protein